MNKLYEIYPISPNVSLFGKKNDTISKLRCFHGFLVSENDKFCWTNSKKELTEEELNNELSKLEKPYLPNSNLIPIIRTLCGQKMKRKMKEDIEEEEQDYSNDYDDEDENENEDEEDLENEDVIEEEVDEDIIDEDDDSIEE